MATLDHRAQNYAAWGYAERIRQLDLVVDEAQLHPSYQANHAAARAMAAQALLEKARLGELADREPEGLSAICVAWAFEALLEIDRLLHAAAQMGRPEGTP